MQAICAEATSDVGADPSVVDLGSALRRLPAGAARPNITRLGSEHEAQLCALLCGLDKAARISRFGHLASNACMQAYAKDAAAGAAYMGGALNAGRLIGVVEVFAARSGVAEVAYRRRRGLAPAGHWLGPA